MFDNVSGKLKSVAKVVCVVGIIVSLISGISYMVAEEFWDFGYSYFFAGCLKAVVGSVLSWVLSLFIYGFGELIEKVNKL